MLSWYIYDQAAPFLTKLSCVAFAKVARYKINDARAAEVRPGRHPIAAETTAYLRRSRIAPSPNCSRHEGFDSAAKAHHHGHRH